MTRHLVASALLLASCSAGAFSPATPLPASQLLTRAPHCIRCVAESDADSEAVNQSPSQVFGKVFGYAFLFSNLAPAFGNALGLLGLWDPPPINLLTAVANNAMDEAMFAGEIPKLMATAYCQGIWVDLLKEYYASGETTEFLTKAGGICAQHAAWCDGVFP